MRGSARKSAIAISIALVIFLQFGLPVVSGGIGHREFDEPDAMVANERNIWIANVSGDSIAELNASNGTLIRLVTSRSYRLDSPDAIALGSGGLWVANLSGDSATELNADNGSLIRVADSRADELGKSVSIATGDGDVWIANLHGNSVTELNSEGMPVRVLRDRLDGPAGVAVSGHYVWVSNNANDTIAIFDASTGALRQVVRLKSKIPYGPSVLTATGTSVWVACVNSVIELSAKSGDILRRITSRSDGFNAIEAIDIASGRVWIANFIGDSVTELKVSNGALVRIISSSVGHFDGPGGIAISGSNVWISNLLSNSLTEIASSTGSMIRVVT